MRVLRILVVGFSIAAAAWGLWRITDGLIQAVAFMFALPAAAITVGLALNAIADSVEEVAGREARRLRRWNRRHESDGSPSSGRSRKQHCGSCQQPLDQVDSLWVCAVCDRAAVGA